MTKHLQLFSIFIISAWVFGCASTNTNVVASREHSPTKVLPVSSLPENSPVKGNMVVRKAKSALGTPYVLGGSKPGGFDCSGLVKWAYNSVGVEVPRTAREQSVIGRKVNDVKDMRAGDIVAFRHPKRGYHTGIYVGGGKFVHSPRKRSHVRINSLSDPYFKDTLLGARRVKLDGSENLVAQAQSRLRDYVEKQTIMSISARNSAKNKSAAKSKASAQTAKKAKTVASKTSTTKKSVIAQQARKVQSVKQITGKGKSSNKNGSAHDKLASASKHTSHKAVSLLSPKKNSKASSKSANSREKQASASKKQGNKAVSMLQTKKNIRAAARRRAS